MTTINQFSPLEVQLIKASMNKKTDEELASILERSVEDVHAKIDELLDGGADDRMRDINKYRDEKAAEAEKKKRGGLSLIEFARKNYLKEQKGKMLERRAEKAKQAGVDEQRIMDNRRQNTRFTLKTKQVDYSQMKTVRINKSTVIWVPKETKDADAKKKFFDCNPNNEMKEKIKALNR